MGTSCPRLDSACSIPKPLLQIRTAFVVQLWTMISTTGHKSLELSENDCRRSRDGYGVIVNRPEKLILEHFNRNLPEPYSASALASFLQRVLFAGLNF